jgi:glutaconate CoA-transferase subunit A
VAAGVLPGLYVSAVAAAPNGAWPLGLPGSYPPDLAELARYAQAARTAEGFLEYLEQASGVAR